MGSLLALLTIALSFVFAVYPSGSAMSFVLLAGLLASLAVAAWLRTRPGLLGGAAMLAWFAVMIVAPFSVTRQQANLLARRARQGDDSAAALLDFYQALQPYALWLMAAITILIFVIYFVGLRRGEGGFFGSALSESNAIARFVEKTGIAAALLFVPMILIIVYDVVQRKYLDIDPGFTATEWYRIFTSTRLQEMQWHLHAVLFLLCLGYAYVRDAHVRIELVRDTLAPRRKASIELAGCLIFLVPYCYVVMQYGLENAMRSYAIMESSSAQTGLPLRFIIKSFLPLGFTVLALAGLSVILKCIVYLFGPPGLRSLAQGPHSGEPLPGAAGAHGGA